ncbi:unnamed protein product [Chironomus riparius]|uniref:BPTI/Kunitz inhibitor domain-containing protein n=1 Tax=Chironomus riparius TaxID=315576 RepID=A0A9N9RX06_9DIPT|nr:unnamed protein product [Chironomus riparius]
MKIVFFLISLFVLIAVMNCDDPQVICKLEEKTGTCRADKPRWYYDASSKSCRLFTYGGCNGNANNFHTEADCMAKCNGV